jgi:hypothetical protein
MRPDGSGDGRDIDGDRGVHGDEFPDIHRLVIFRAHARRDTGDHMNGMARRGAVTIAAGGKLWIALAVNLDQMLGQRRQFRALISVVRPEVRFHNNRRGIGVRHPQQFHRGRAEPAGPGQIRRRRAQRIVPSQDG